jgi:4-hydroxybenzoate polyprenyltransferase
MDEQFDRKQGLHSLPSRWGSAAALRWSAAFQGAAFLALAVLYLGYFRSPAALVALIAVGGLLALQQRLAHRVEWAFFRINAVLGFVVLGFVASGVKGSA